MSIVCVDRPIARFPAYCEYTAAEYPKEGYPDEKRATIVAGSEGIAPGDCLKPAPGSCFRVGQDGPLEPLSPPRISQFQGDPEVLHGEIVASVHCRFKHRTAMRSAKLYLHRMPDQSLYTYGSEVPDDESYSLVEYWPKPEWTQGVWVYSVNMFYRVILLQPSVTA